MTPRVLFEDDWLLAVDKPAGLAVHPGAGLGHDTLDTWIASHLGPRALRNGFRATAAHRLDRGTSGVVLVACRRPAMTALMKAFEARRVEKHYVALVRGSPGDSGRIEAPVDTRPAVTRWVAQVSVGAATLVDCNPETGRHHQIRVHFAGVSHPLAGDAEHGDPAFNAHARSAWGLERLFLHASRLVFPHPRDGSPRVVEAPLPAELNAVLLRARGGH